MNIHFLYNLFRPYFQRKRQQMFYRLMKPLDHERILDVGGDHWFWSAAMECRLKVTCLNRYIPQAAYDTKRFSYVQGDGRQLPYLDKEYDIVFSNSTIEHVGTFDDQHKFASEIRRTGKRYWVQTPNKWFFMEPHFITPLIHYLPQSFQKKLIRHFTVWGLVTKPSQEQITNFLASIRLLTRKDMKRLFPDGSLYEERFLFFVKSFVAYKASDDELEMAAI